MIKEIVLGYKKEEVDLGPEMEENEMGFITVDPVTFALVTDTEIEDGELFIWVTSNDGEGEDKKVPVAYNRQDSEWVITRGDEKLVNKPLVKLVGEDGNVFSIMGRCKRASEKAGWTKEQWKAFQKEMTAGDYYHALATVQRFFAESEESDSSSVNEYYIPGKHP